MLNFQTKPSQQSSCLLGCVVLFQVLFVAKSYGTFPAVFWRILGQGKCTINDIIHRNLSLHFFSAQIQLVIERKSKSRYCQNYIRIINAWPTTRGCYRWYLLRILFFFNFQFAFITCCVRSEEPVTSHRQSLVNILTERNWRKTNDFVIHACGCYSQSQRTRSVRRGLISDPDVCQLFGVVGVPTLILLDSSGQQR